MYSAGVTRVRPAAARAPAQARGPHASTAHAPAAQHPIERDLAPCVRSKGEHPRRDTTVMDNVRSGKQQPMEVGERRASRPAESSRRLSDLYEIGDELGSGGFSTVRVGRRKRSGAHNDAHGGEAHQRVAIKTIQKHATNVGNLEMIQNEVMVRPLTTTTTPNARTLATSSPTLTSPPPLLLPLLSLPLPSLPPSIQPTLPHPTPLSIPRAPLSFSLSSLRSPHSPCRPPSLPPSLPLVCCVCVCSLSVSDYGSDG